MALYEELVDTDVVTPVRELIGKTVRLTPEGTFEPILPPVMDPAVDWIFACREKERHCKLWFSVYFKNYGLISRNCFNCWKIVVRPKTLKDLVKLMNFQRDLGLPGKCGLEKRNYATYKGWYAGFWYCPFPGTQDSGREYYRKIATEFHKVFPINEPIILKRACTEMEEMAGPTDRWGYPEGQGMYEDLLDAVWKMPLDTMEQPTMLKRLIMRHWIEYAFEHGDPTVKEFVESIPESFNVKKTVVYHDVKREIASNPEVRYVSPEV